jgi:hypothetical protein
MAQSLQMAGGRVGGWKLHAAGAELSGDAVRRGTEASAGVGHAMLLDHRHESGRRDHLAAAPLPG